jgi:hypothetical protein
LTNKERERRIVKERREMEPNGPKKSWEQRATEAGTRLRDEVQDELRRVVRFIDAEVVPEVRRNGSTALRAAAERLQRLAQHMDDSKPSGTDKQDGDE